MSTSYRKIEYDEEGAWGSTDKRYLYVSYNSTVDGITVLDDHGDILFSFTEWSPFDMGKALNVILTDYYNERLILISKDEFNNIKNE